MLDDLKYIHERDAQDALGIAEKQWQQLEYKFELPKFDFQPLNVVYAGMGGSALAAQISLTWPGYQIPFEIVRNYSIPAYVSSDTLFVVSSYSGNTEEAISALTEAEAKHAHILIIASGGKLAELAQSKNHPLLLLPVGLQPRHAVLYNLKALVVILEHTGLVAESSAEQSIHEAGTFLRAAIATWAPTVPTKDNRSKQIALDLVGKSIVVYSGPKLYPAAYKWKISFNENAKHIAWVNQYSELNHNEMLGWTKQPVDKPYGVVELRSNLEHPRIQKRFEVTARLLSGMRPEPIVVDTKGETLLEQLLWTIALGDFTSLYLALLNNLNPTPVELIEKFKKALDE